MKKEPNQKKIDFQKATDEAIKRIPFKRANAIKDREGFVEILGLGKIHIKNWK